MRVKGTNKKDIKSIVFFGEDSFSCIILQSLIDAGYEVKLVVTPLYENVIYKRLQKLCERYHITIIRLAKINSRELVERLAACDPDMCVIAHFGRLIRKELLSVSRNGFINLHPSMLPYYRGRAPQHWPLINEEPEAGITVHYVDEGADTGDIIVQHKIPLNPDMTVTDLQRIWMQHYRTIMVEALDRIKDGADVVEQKDDPGSYYGKLTVEDCEIVPEMSARQAYNLIRAVTMPYFGARYGKYVIYSAEIVEDVPHDIAAHADGLYEETSIGPILKLHDGVLSLKNFHLLQN